MLVGGKNERERERERAKAFIVAARFVPIIVCRGLSLPLPLEGATHFRVTEEQRRIKLHSKIVVKLRVKKILLKSTSVRLHPGINHDISSNTPRKFIEHVRTLEHTRTQVSCTLFLPFHGHERH